MKIKFLSEVASLPKRVDEGAAGFDLVVPRDVMIVPGRQVVPLDIAMDIDQGYEGHIRPRSGFSAKGMEGYIISQSGDLITKRFDADVEQGTIDHSYRGNIGAIVKSNETQPFYLKAKTRIAQMVISKCYTGELEVVTELDETERGTGGFGHTGA